MRRWRSGVLSMHRAGTRPAAECNNKTPTQNAHHDALQGMKGVEEGSLPPPGGKRKSGRHDTLMRYRSHWRCLGPRGRAHPHWRYTRHGRRPPTGRRQDATPHQDTTQGRNDHAVTRLDSEAYTRARAQIATSNTPSEGY